MPVAAAAPLISSVQKLVLYETRAVSSVPPAAAAGPGVAAAAQHGGDVPPCLGRVGLALPGAAASAGLQLVKNYALPFSSCVGIWFFLVTHSKHPKN